MFHPLSFPRGPHKMLTLFKKIINDTYIRVYVCVCMLYTYYLKTYGKTIVWNLHVAAGWLCACLSFVTNWWWKFVISKPLNVVVFVSLSVIVYFVARDAVLSFPLALYKQIRQRQRSGTLKLRMPPKNPRTRYLQLILHNTNSSPATAISILSRMLSIAYF